MGTKTKAQLALKSLSKFRSNYDEQNKFHLYKKAKSLRQLPDRVILTFSDDSQIAVITHKQWNNYIEFTIDPQDMVMP